MSTNEPQGHGQSGDPQQNPYGKPPQPPQSPYDAQTYGPPPPQQNPQGQPQNAYGQPYAQQQPPYAQPQQHQLPPWLSQPGAYGGPPAPGSRALASAGDRLLARLVDMAVLLVPTILLYLLTSAMSSIIYAVASTVMFLGYEAAMLITQNGQTVGKKVMKIRVVALEGGGRPTDNAFWARAGVYAGPQAIYCIGTVFGLLDVLWQLWDKPFQQCLHDKAAKTVVVKES